MSVGAELTGSCVIMTCRCRSVLANLIPQLTEEDLISSALAANDDLSRALREHEALLQGEPAVAGGAAAALAAGVPGDGAGVPGAASSSAVPAAAASTAGEDGRQ